jgi:hypothetical protein
MTTITNPLPEGYENIVKDGNVYKFTETATETSPKLLEHLNGLQTAISTYNTTPTSEQDHKTLFSYVYDRLSMIHFASEMSKELNVENSRKDFEQDKNRLITLMAKNDNIYSKLNSQKMNFYIFLGMLVLYTIGLVFVYAQSGLLNNEMQAMLLIGLSLTVLIVFAIVDLYQMVTRQHYEGFNTEGWDEDKMNKWTEVYDAISSTWITATDTDTGIQNMIDELVKQFPNIVKYNNLLRNDETNKTKKDVISNILHDFNNQNYVNMRRYQLTDYKINETRSKMHFVKYAFLLVSTIGLLAGLHLRTEMGLASNYMPISKTVLTSVAVLLVVTFLFIYFMHQKQNMMRKKYNWNKLYWNVKATHNTQGDYLYMP